MCPWLPSSEADLTRGRVQPSSEADLARGAFSPRARRTSPEGATGPIVLVGRGGHWGCNYVVRVLGLQVCLHLRFHFLRKKMGFPGLFRGPLWLSLTSSPQTSMRAIWVPKHLEANLV
jgi:hypothetical protein